MDKNQDKAGVIIFPPLLYLIATLLSALISYLLPYSFLEKNIQIGIGVPLLIIGILIVTTAARLFTKNKTTVHPKGSTTLIVSSGIYRFTRNPMYLGFTLIFLGILLVTNSWFGFVLLLPLLIIVQNGIIKREERYLDRKFGKDYLNYKKRVRRWL